MKRFLLFVSSVAFGLMANAQVATSDAAWCGTLQQALEDNGMQSEVRCDIQEGQKVLHVTTNGNTKQYVLRNNNTIDYSSPVYIIASPFTLRQENMMRGQGHRMWLGMRSSTYQPDEVYSVPADVDMLEAKVRSAIAGVERVTLVDGDFSQNAELSGVPMLLLRGNVVAIQRGDKFEPIKADNPQRDRRPKIERTCAYANVHFELVDYRTGEIVWQTDASDNNYTTSSFSDPMESVVRSISNRVANKLHDMYPTSAPRLACRGNVLRANEVKKEKAESVFINVGTSQELHKGDTFAVYESFDVDGQEGQKQIGTLSITEVQGPQLSLCKVKKGEKEIYAALQRGSAIVVRSTY